jgi:hypothetical protein
VVEIDDTILLRARVLDQNGDSIDADLRWRTPDTTVGVDSLAGAFWGISTGSGRVQPTAGSLVGPTASFSVRERADTVIVAPEAESLLVAAVDTESVPLEPRVARFNGDGLSDRVLILRLLEPTDSSVVLSGDVLADTVTTQANGTPAAAIRIKKRGTPPDSAVVEVGARRVSGDTVAGSGQRIRIFFE